MSYFKLFEQFVNEGRSKKPDFQQYNILSNLSPDDHDKAIKELEKAGVEINFADDFDKKRGFITIDKKTLTPEQVAILDKWKKIGDSFTRQKPSYESKNPKDIEKFIMQLPDTTDYLSVPNSPDEMVASTEFSPKKDKNWKKNAVKHMNDTLKKGDIYNIEFGSFTGGPIRGYASWYIKFRTKGGDEFGRKMASGEYGKLD